MRRLTWLTNLMVVAAVTSIGCGKLAYNLPPSQQIMHPGPGVGGPGPGVIPVGNQMTRGGGGPAGYIGPGGSPGAGVCQTTPPAMGMPAMGAGMTQGLASMGGPTGGSGPRGPQGGIQQVQYCEDGSCSVGGGAGCFAGPPAGGATSQIAFVGEDGLQISWSTSGGNIFDSSPLVVPGRQDFPQGAIYRLKLQNIPGRAGVTLYPTLEVGPVTPRTDAYLAHAPVPVQFTEEDFDQVISGNYVTKVIYLPDPEFQELALAGVETLVSTRLDPGCDPVAEADRRGSILAIVRIGNKNLETNGQPTYEGNVIPAGFEGNEASLPEDFTDAAGEQAQYEEAQYCEGCEDGSCPLGGCNGGNCYQGAVPGGLAGGPMPVGMRTSGFAPRGVPPHMVGGAPQWGMPMSGTPIGLPGPPHIPHGVPAGLKSHVMKNRTRHMIPPPVKQVTMSVKQRPGLNYPTPVNKVHIDETQRAPFKMFGGTVPGLFQSIAAKLKGGDNCNDCQ